MIDRGGLSPSGDLEACPTWRIGLAALIGRLDRKLRNAPRQPAPGGFAWLRLTLIHWMPAQLFGRIPRIRTLLARIAKGGGRSA